MVRSRDALFALLLLGSTVSLEVQITPSHGEISVGESKFFLCEVVGAAKQIDWFGPTGERIEPNRPDVTVTRNDEWSSTLTLYSAGSDDAGTYKCVAANGEHQAEATVNVKIYQKITFTNAPSPQEFNEGDTAVIVCDVVSEPPPSVFWKHKGARIQMEKDVRFKVLSNNHLQIRGIKKTDEGSYTCEGRLMVRGEIDLRVIKVVVNVLPTIRVWQSEVNSTADMGKSAMLTCAVDGYPEPLVTWTRNGVVLDAVEKYSFNEDGSEMTIMHVAKLDEGEYTCIARNKAGESEQELSLRVFVKPKISYLVNQSTSEMDEQVTLTCEAQGDPTPTINWSYGVHVFTEGEQAHLNRIYQSVDGNVVVRSDARVSSLTLKFVKYTDAGQYLCTARNAIGEDAQLAHLEVLYAPKIQGSAAVYTWEGNAVNISCEVQAHPSDVSILWLRDGQPLPNANTSNLKIFKSPSSSFLEVTPESENEFGSYNCSASNQIGTESKEFLLIQADVPSAPSIEGVEPFSSTARVQYQEPEATGGVPILRYRAEWRMQGLGSWQQNVYDVEDGSLTEVTIVGLKPETNYEIKMSAVNGKGEGESSPALIFKTEPVRKPSPPKLEGALQPEGNSIKVTWVKQDDGGSPIFHYLVRYKPKHISEWKQEIRLPSGSDYVVLSGLEWDTDYEVFVVAENQKGKSQPGTFSTRTMAEPSAIPADLSDETAIPMGIIAGILVVAFVLLLLAVDITCFFVNKCGLIMCLCGSSGTWSKGGNMEEGKAAFIKDESKEAIVEVRTEDECTANHNAAGPTEPNETTPLTEPELAAYTAALALDNLSSVATNSDTATATFDPALDSPSSETTTLTCSLSTPANDPSPTPAPAPTPESNVAPPAPLISTSAVTAKMAPLIEQKASNAPKPEENVTTLATTTPPCTPERPKSATPIPPKRRNSPKLAALNMKGSLPVSALTTSSSPSSSTSASPTQEGRKRAPRPPGLHASTQPAPEPLDAETPHLKTASARPATSAAAKPDAALESSLTPFEDDKLSEQASTKDEPNPAKDPAAAVHDAPKGPDAEEPPRPLLPGILAPIPSSAPPASSLAGLEPPVSNDLPPVSTTYDLLTSGQSGPGPEVPGSKAAQLDLELPNGLEGPAAAPVDLISLDSPPAAFLSNRGGAGLPTPASETRAKAAHPAHDEYGAL